MDHWNCWEHQILDKGVVARGIRGYDVRVTLGDGTYTVIATPKKDLPKNERGAGYFLDESGMIRYACCNDREPGRSDEPVRYQD